MLVMNRRGPRTDPGGIPFVICLNANLTGVFSLTVSLS